MADIQPTPAPNFSYTSSPATVVSGVQLSARPALGGITGNRPQSLAGRVNVSGKLWQQPVN